MEMQLFYDVLIILALSLLSVFICNKIKIPPIAGFLIAGVAAGPYALGLVAHSHEVEIMGEIGVILLLFTIGIEFSFSKLLKIKKNILLGGTLQVAATIGVFYLLGRQFGYTSPEAIFFGFLAALSSTAVILNILQRQGSIDSPEGKIVLSILIFQDLAIVPMMIFTPIIAGGAENPLESVALLSLQVVLLLALVIVLTRWVMPFLMHQIARTRIRELFLIAVVLLCSGIVLVTYLSGLSLALGAFLAGLIISESEYNHQALGHITPFKDIFSSFFFVSIGMMLDLGFLAQNLWIILAVIGSIFIIKIITGAFAAIALKYPLRIAIITGFTLFQIGEFSLILSRTGIENGLMNDFDYQVFLAAAVVMMAFTPFVIRWGRSAAEASVRYRLPGFLSRELVSNEDYEHKFEDHIVIIGYGLVGRNIVRAAKIADIPYVIIEMNPDTVKSEKEAGEPIFFGDSTKEEVLIHAGVKKANTVVVAISDPTAERAITGLARSLNPHAYIIVRTRYVGETGPLTKLGADEVIPEEYETSIEIFALVLSKYLVPAAEIEQFISHVRREGYSMLRSVSQSRMTGGQLRLHAPDYEMRTYRVTKDSPLDGKRIADSNLRSDFDTMILLIKRDGESHPNPPADMHLREGDLVVMFGKSANLISCRDLFRCE